MDHSGIEPESAAYQATVLPLNYKVSLEPARGIEPRSRVYEARALPTELHRQQKQKAPGFHRRPSLNALLSLAHTHASDCADAGAVAVGNVVAVKRMNVIIPLSAALRRFARPRVF